ncbi:DUF1641 domain protein (plasmid) [Natrialba magadii ATCC 43099]|uniref:DUF1641 domain protein n=1 Tax=Natrialba magadii (strain ATCC 43099 / DSM 3394 / CCM 3739 / CIP 104546 / IAM 13178 / JCM 8861 / NBRC 102185 / NCIMB 2190 / MS3) TaxID=547559 RepID=D3T1V7_NATMM|nr:DUF1641 domain-containing protein [Natrialba magadii]ADD07566.1 DUF1641 domain protein [Natrialba magadii ATCC 43099]ELY27206.1 hypothetical protein C500_14415 [Natrialba magadii ATCC 43099]
MTNETITDEDDLDRLLVEAIETNPEAVAAFVHRKGHLEELFDAPAFETDRLDDRLLEVAAGTEAAMSTTEDTDRLAAVLEEHSDDLATGLERVARLEATGDLETLVGLANTIALLAAAVDDDIVMSVGGTAGSLGEVADTTADPDTVAGVQTLLEGLSEAAGEKPPEQVGTVELMRTLRNPDVQRGLGFLVAMVRAVGVQLEDERESIDRAAEESESRGERQ